MVAGGVVAALVAVVLYAASTVLQALAGRRAAATHRGTLSMRDLVVQPVWWLAVGLLGLAFLAFVVSTRVLPLPAAEALRSSYLAVAVVLGHLVFRTRPRPRESAGVVLTLAGLALFLGGGGQRGDCTPTGALPVAMALALGAVVVVDAVLARVGRLSARLWGAIEAALAGAAFAVLDMGVRSLPDPFTAGGVLSAPESWIAVVAAPLGLLLFSRAAARTSVAVATTLLLVVNVVGAAVWAAAAYCDAVSGAPALIAAAVTSMVVGTVLVATGVPAAGPDAGPPEELPGATVS